MCLPLRASANQVFALATDPATDAPTKKQIKKDLDFVNARSRHHALRHAQQGNGRKIHAAIERYKTKKEGEAEAQYTKDHLAPEPAK